MTLGPADGALSEADLRPLVPTEVRDPDVSLNFDLVVVCSSACHYFSIVTFSPFLDCWRSSMER